MYTILKRISQKQILTSFNYNFASLKKKDDLFTVSLIGAPNVGKSSLFNKLSTDSQKAIVDKTEGLTRDRKEQISNILGYPIRIVDTAGIEQLPDVQYTGELKQKMMKQTIQALIHSDLALFLVDVRKGITKQDQDLSLWLKKHQQENQQQEQDEQNQKKGEEIKVKKMLFLANKLDHESLLESTNFLNEVYSLGLGEPLYISAQNGHNISDLLRSIDNEVDDEIKKKYQQKQNKKKEDLEELKRQEKEKIIELIQKEEAQISIDEWEKEFDRNNQVEDENEQFDDEQSPIKLTIVGRANAGKSTLINKLIKEERIITHDQKGTTRDSINVEWEFRGKKFILTDTAGIDQRINKVSDVERKCQVDTLKSIKNSQVVVCMIDSLRAFQVQDLSLVQYVCDQGKAVVLVVNKWDLVPEEYKKKAIRYMERQLEKNLGQVKGVFMYCTSVEQEENTDSLMNLIIKAYEKWNFRVTTGQLNDWLVRFKKVQSLPTDGNGNTLKIRFFSQVKSRPPTFVAFVNDKSLIKTNYLRFMRYKLAEEFGIEGTPIRILIREGNMEQNIDQNNKKLSDKYLAFKKRKLEVKKIRRKAKLAKLQFEQMQKS